jgi:signal transduction histidine kinase
MATVQATTRPTVEPAGWLAAARARLARLPLLKRLVLGNSLVIIVGAVGGTTLTQQITRRLPDSQIGLIAAFAGTGLLLSLLVNYWVVKTSLRPLRELRQAVDRIEAGHAAGHPRALAAIAGADPDLSRLAAAVDSLVERMEERAEQLRALSERAINAQEEERKRIARGLHDDIGQAVSRLMIDLERVEGALPPEAAGAREQIAAGRRLARGILDDLRSVVYGLRPAMLDDLGLASAIRWYARSNLEPAGARLRFEGFDEALRLEPRLEITLFRIGQEAINNILRHAEASQVCLSLAPHGGPTAPGGRVWLRIEDNGRGFDAARVARQALRLQRFGLLGMRERAELVGGEARVESSPGQGTKVEVWVPAVAGDG